METTGALRGVILVLSIASASCEGAAQRETAPSAIAPGDAADVADEAVDPAIRLLFDRYAKQLSEHELGRSTAYFAPSFLLSTPTGSVTLVNDESHLAAVRAEDAYYRETLGMTSARITHITQVSLANSGHVLVRTRWGCTFGRTRDRIIELPRSFLLDMTRPSPKITAQIVEIDEPTLFHTLGLI